MSSSSVITRATGSPGIGDRPSVGRKKKNKPVAMDLCIDTGNQRSCSALADESARFDCLTTAVWCCLDATVLEAAMSCLATYYPYSAEGDAPGG